MTYDEAAVAVMLDAKLTDGQKSRKLDALWHAARKTFGDECPECGSDDTDENTHGNTFICYACGYQWDAEE